MGVCLIRLKIYGRIEGDRKNEPDTVTPIVGKQYNILLWQRKTHWEQQQEKTALLITKSNNKEA